jgi:hypothetical protein
MKRALLSTVTGSVAIFSSVGVSTEAKAVATMFYNLDRDSMQPVSLGKAKSDALQSLSAAFCEACQPGWDGYGAVTASFDSYAKAEKFIRALPANIPPPEVAVDPDGEISLEWYRNPSRVFSVSIGADDSLTYAGLFGASRTRGVETFNLDIPKIVLDNLRRLLA